MDGMDGMGWCSLQGGHIELGWDCYYHDVIKYPGNWIGIFTMGHCQ
tara:strand:- start:877 stop:1014 length:138 start_codon:yes stop_codon:yes gene_type:complete